MLFVKADVDNILRLKCILKEFESVSGQRINYEKSELSVSNNINQNLARAFGSILGMKVVEKVESYLGLPICLNGRNTAMLNYIEDRMWKRVYGWKEKLLSMPGKEVLIKSVVQVIPVYALSCYGLPKRIFDRWNSIIYSFWWNNAKEGRFIGWKDKFTLQRSKEDGGLGFKNFQLTNTALLIKQAWRIHSNPELLISKIFKSKYHRLSSFLEVQVGSRASWACRSIQRAAQYIKRWMTVGEGLQGLSNVIIGDRDFSTRAAYVKEENKKIADLKGECSDKGTVRQFWRLKVHNKSKIFMWRLFYDGVLVSSNLRRRGCLADANCVICGFKEETSTHLFLQCWWARELWKHLLSSAQFLDHNFSTIGEWIWFCVHELDGEDIVKVFCGARWIWWNRNKLWHNEEGVDLQMAISQVLRTVKELSQVKHRFIISRPESGHRWEPPEEDELKISCDGAWNPVTKEAGLGVVCRDNLGKVQCVAATFLHHQTNVTEVEGKAVLLGMKLARDLKLKKVTFESDNIEVIQALLSQSKFTMKGWSWLSDCNRLLDLNKLWFFEHIMREANLVADLLAQKAREDRWEWKSSDSVPLFLSQAVCSDRFLAGLDP